MASKDSQTYWKDREIEHARLMLKEDKEVAKVLAALYQDTSAEIERTVLAMLERYAENNELTIADVRRQIAMMDIRDYESKAARYVREKDFSPRANEELTLYNLKMKTSRLQLIEAHINLDLTALTVDVERVIGDRLIGRGYAEVIRQSGILGETININRSGLEYIARRQFHGDDFSGHLWKNKRLLHDELQKRLSEFIITGQSSKDAARKLRGIVNQTVYNSERIMVTEGARVQTEVQMASYKDAAIDQYEYIATEKACSVCEPLDGKIMRVADAAPGLNMAPMHPHCRCSTAPYAE